MPASEPMATTVIAPFRERPVDLPKEPHTKKPKSKTLIVISGGAVGIALLGSLLWIILSPPTAKNPSVKAGVEVAKQETPPAQPPPVVASVPPPPLPKTTTDAEDRAKDFMEQGRNYIRVKDYEKGRAALSKLSISIPRMPWPIMNWGLPTLILAIRKWPWGNMEFWRSRTLI